MSTTSSPLSGTLPAEFADLEPFAGLGLPSERERYAKRIASSMDELQAFYDAAFPRLEAAIAYLDQFPLDDAARRRRSACCGCATRSSRCRSRSRCGASPRVPDSGAASFDAVYEPAI